MQRPGNLEHMLKLTTNGNGARLNLANFRKIYDHHNTQLFKGDLKNINKKLGFAINQVYSRDQYQFHSNLCVDLYNYNKNKDTLYGKDISYFSDNIKQFYPNTIGFSRLEISRTGTTVTIYFPQDTDYTQDPVSTFSWDQTLRNTLGFQNNTQLLLYMVEEFILDELCISNDPNMPRAAYKEQLNNIYFHHERLLQHLVIDNSIYSVLQL